MKYFNIKISEIKIIDKFYNIIRVLLNEEDNLKENNNLAKTLINKITKN